MGDGLPFPKGPSQLGKECLGGWIGWVPCCSHIRVEAERGRLPWVFYPRACYGREHSIGYKVPVAP